MIAFWNLSQLLKVNKRNDRGPYFCCNAIRTFSSSGFLFVIGLLAAIALTMGRAGAALAAPRHSPASVEAPTETPPSPPEPAPEFTWAGFYVGSNFGGGFGVGSGLSGFGTDAMLGPSEFWAFPGPNSGGPLGGVQAGYLWQFGGGVVGFEADMQAAGLSGSSKTVGAALGPLPIVAAHQTIDWFGTVRGRVGYAATPTLLLYGTGGLAYGGGGLQFAYFKADGSSAGGVSNSTRLGWAAGGGAEWAFLPDWSAKLEYLYVDLGRSPGRAFNALDGDGETITNAAALSGAANRFHAVRAGLNYHFNISGPDLGAPAEPYYHAASDKFHEIETHYIFGFTDGADIDAEGVKELEIITKVNQGRRRLSVAPDDPDALALISQGRLQGDYRSIAQTVEFEHTLTQNFQYSLGVTGVNHRIRGVEGLDDLSNTSLLGISGEFRYVLLGRGPESPFGVTLQFEPEWGHVSSTSGRPETAFEVESKLIVDTEFIPNRLYGAVNILYEPEVSRGLGEQKWERESTFGVTGGMTYRVTPQLALGAGVQYYRAHSDGYWFNKLEGQALFAGPTLYAKLDRKIFVSAAFSAQVRGHAAGETHALDLSNFNRYMARLQFGIEF
jgi:opacity protein-like surface antigen